MPAVTGAKLLGQLLFLIRPGNHVYVDPTSGNDTTGDGSQFLPYATLTRGFQDVVSGNFDVVFYVGQNSGNPFTNEPGTIRVSSKNDWMLVGLNKPILGAPSAFQVGNPLASSPTASAGDLVVDVDAGVHTATSVGDLWFFQQFTQTLDNRVNGMWELTAKGASPSLTFSPYDTSHVQIVNGFGEPFLSSGSGRMYPISLAIEGCENVYVMNLGFGESIDRWSGVAVTGEQFSQTFGNRVRFFECDFRNGFQAWVRLGQSVPAFGTKRFFPGIGMEVESCRFLSEYASNKDKASAGRSLPFIALDGGASYTFEKNTFVHQGLITIDPTQVIRRYSEGPQFGALFFDNLFDDEIPLTEVYGPEHDGKYGGTAHSTFGVDEPSHFFGNNFFPAVPGEQRVIISDGGKQDRFSQSIINEVVFPTNPNLVNQQETGIAAEDPGTIGYTIVSGLYQGAVWYSGSGSAGTTIGVNGLPGNPVNSAADARTIADALGLRKVVVLSGQLTLNAEDWGGWTFEGRGTAGGGSLVSPGLHTNLHNAHFQDIRIVGSFLNTVPGPQVNSEVVTCVRCRLDDVQNFVGTAFDCVISGTITLGRVTSVGDDEAVFVHCASALDGDLVPVFDLQSQSGSGTFSLGVRGMSGGLELQNVKTITGAGDVVVVDEVAGKVVLASSCDGGRAIVRGIGQWDDQSTGTAIERDAFLNLPVIAAAQEDLRTQLFFASAEIASGQGGRFVPQGAASHMLVQVRIKGASDFSAPAESYYVVFNYQAGGDSGSAAATTHVQATAPVDGTFTSEPFPG